MTIFDEDGKEREKVPLHTITEKPLLHQLMRDKGFVLKSSQEIAAVKEQSLDASTSLLRSLNEREARRLPVEDYLNDTGPSYTSMFGLYGVALVSVVALVARRRTRKMGR